MAYNLRCTDCGESQEPGGAPRCRRCGGILECVYPRQALVNLRQPRDGEGLARFAPGLPVDVAFLPYLGEGQTPLLPSRVIAKTLGLANLYFKDETQNPTGSFKDRGISVSVAMALRSKSKGLMTVSSGNGAASLATYAAACQLPGLVLVDSQASPQKLQQIAYMGATCLKIEGLFEKGSEPLCDLIAEVSQSLDYRCAFSWAPINPYSVEGPKTIAYECASAKPDVVICPVAGGDNLAGQWKGYRELYEAGAIEKRPRMIGVQPTGSAPLILAYSQKSRQVSPIAKATTVASGLKTTFSGDHALRAIYASGGSAIGVDDDDFVKWKDSLARLEGIWVETSSAITIAALPRLLASNLIRPEERVICVLTGAGYKEGFNVDIEQGIEVAGFNPQEIIQKYAALRI